MKHTLSLLLLFALTTLSAQTEKAQPIFKDGEAQTVPAFENAEDWIRHDLFVETTFDTDGDGKMDRMHVDVTRPKHTETEGLKLPVVYASSPYYSGVASGGNELFWDVKHELGEAAPADHVHPEVTHRSQRPVISNSEVKKWVPLGYIVVHSCSPGTGLSQGSPTVGGENESLAPKAVIDWLNGRAKGYTEATGGEEVKAYWTTGKVGMTGTSYNGTLPLAAATTGVEGLEAIIPIAPNTSYYHYYRSNGLVRSPGGYLGEDLDVLYDFIHSGAEDKRARNNRVVRDTEMKNGIDRITGDYNDFWASRDYLNHMGPMKAALLMSHGFNDWNVMPEHSYRIYAKAKEMGLSTQVYYHQNGHGGPPPMKMMNRWFTRYLHGVENDVENDAEAWIVRERDDPQKPTAYDDYPNPKAEDVTLYPTAGAPGHGRLGLFQTRTRKQETITDNYSFKAAALADAEFTEHRLMYVLPTLKEDLHLSGTPQVSVRMSANKARANLSVYLVSLPWEEGRRTVITDNLITRGWADFRNHKDLHKEKDVKPGEFVNVSFDLMPDDQIIRAGQQIGLMIFASDKEFTLWPQPGTQVTVDLSGTSISLPVVGGREALERALFE
jgi:X-Pro dipeptidyl-peptidase